MPKHSVKVYIDTALALDYYLATHREWPDDHFIDTRSEYEKAEEMLWTELLKNNKRLWYEADLNYSGGYRGSERLVYSNDGKIYYSGDHYKSFQQLGGR
jgi:hypothetical protein